MPAPGSDHAFTITILLLLLGPLVKALGVRISAAPMDVFFAGANPVQPDIVVLLAERLHLVSERGIEGAPNLLIEVLSPSNPEHDLITKRELYARGGVPEYWLVTPKTGTVEVLALDGTVYRTHVRAAGDQVVTSLVLAGLSFPASAAFA